MNKAAIKSLSSIEIQRIRNALGLDKTIDNFYDFKMFFEEASKLMIPEFMNATFSFPEENKMEWVFTQGKCFAYTGVKRLGVIDKYECSVMYRIKCWLEELGIKHNFNPEINKCLMHHKGDCSGKINLFL